MSASEDEEFESGSEEADDGSDEGSGEGSDHEDDEDAQNLVARVMDADEALEELGPAQMDGLRHLCCLDATPLDDTAVKDAAKTVDGLERFLHKAATQASESLITALWKLPVERTKFGPVATLPSKGLTLPREKPLPEPKPETRWEKFAREKGIDNNKKRSRMVWDDVEQKWAPRHGFQRAYGEDDVPIIEHDSKSDPNEDPWSLAKADKKGRVAKNNAQRAKNEERSGRASAKANPGIPVDLGEAAAGSGVSGAGGKKVTHKGKDAGLKALGLAQHSTASMGKFDVKRFGEPAQHKLAGTRKAKGGVGANDTTSAGLATEKNRQEKVLGRVLAAHDRGPAKPSFKGAKGERIEARKRSREFHPLDDAPYQNLGGGDAGEYKKKKGRAAAGKMTKVTKKRIK